jgi:polyisoprenoid-binding protein YceI
MFVTQAKPKTMIVSRLACTLAFAVMLLPISGSAQGNQRRYVIDDSQSDVLARVGFLGLSHKDARFPDMNGSLTISFDDPDAVQMTVDVDARTLTTGDSQTARLRGAQFFDVAHHPSVRFVGERIAFTGERTATVTGRMTARGITRPSTVTVTFSRPPIALGQDEPLSIVGTTTIDRRQFGMTAFPIVVGNQVAITIRARMVPG